MRVLVLYNPVSGVGRAIGRAEDIGGALKDAGHSCTLAPTQLEPVADWLDPIAREHDAMVVVGGDGAVRMVSGAAARTGTPIYHYPAGTENLFAREFGFDRTTPRLLSALQRNEVRHVDVGFANDQLFLLMVSIGFDAQVVHDLVARRTGGISHASYAAPILRQLWRYAPPAVTIEVDGKIVLEHGRGFVVIANSRQYGARLDPAPHASMSDGALDVVYFPAPRRRHLIGWMIACRRGRHVTRAGLGGWSGAAIRLITATEGPFQLDGDAPAPPGVTKELAVTVRPGWLPVLVP